MKPTSAIPKDLSLGTQLNLSLHFKQGKKLSQFKQKNWK